MFAGLRKISTFASAIAEIAQLVEHNLAKVRVASSSLVFRSFYEMIAITYAQVAELVDAHVSGACVERRAGSTPVLGTRTPSEFPLTGFCFFHTRRHP